MNFNTETRRQDYLERAAWLPYGKVTLDEPKDSLTRFLSPVERGTIRVEAPLHTELVLGNSLLHYAAYRLSLLESKGILQYASGFYVAQSFQYVFYGGHPMAMRLAKRGWVLLAALDSADLGIKVWTSAEPVPEEPYHFRRMRLHERLDELSRVDFSLLNTSPERDRPSFC